MYQERETDEYRKTVSHRIAQLHEIAPGSIGDMMNYRVLECCGKTGECLLECDTFPWMRNAQGTLHGGMCATVVDQAMGFVAYCVKAGEGLAPTVQMQVEYHRPLLPGSSAMIRVRVVSESKSLMHLSAEVYQSTAPDKLCLTASGVYFYKAAPHDGSSGF